jgi:hypothetical protein
MDRSYGKSASNEGGRAERGLGVQTPHQRNKRTEGSQYGDSSMRFDGEYKRLSGKWAAGA